MRRIPYRGGAPATNDTLADQVSAYFITPLEGLGQVQAGTLKSLRISTTSRSPLFPDVPTINETLPDFRLWSGLASSRLPAPRQRSWPSLTMQSRSRIATPSVQDALKKLGVEPKSSTPESFAATIRADVDRWAKVVNEANIPLD